MKKAVLLLMTTILLSFSTNNSDNIDPNKLPDVTREFDATLKETKSTFRKLKSKWGVDEKMIIRDLKKFSTENILERNISKYYRDYDSWRNVEAQIRFLIGYFETNGKGDIKNRDFKKYNSKNSGRVIYRGQEYTVEQLGNINFGAALNAFGYPREPSICAGGLYQIYADKCIPVARLEYKNAIKRCITTKTGVCMDYRGDSKMIRKGYNEF